MSQRKINVWMGLIILSVILWRLFQSPQMFANDSEGGAKRLARFETWNMHVIDDSSRGADGVRLADFNKDGFPDIATGWEEGGVIRVYKNPGPKKSKEKWPKVTVGKVKSPEDAVFVDLDSDGVLDVVTCCEGKTKTVYVHWAPEDPSKYLEDNAWKTEAFPVLAGKSAWMFAAPANIDQKNGVDLFVGSKGGGGCVGWLESPENPRELGQWKFHKIVSAGWVMSLRPIEINGSIHLLVSDRKGPKRGVYFLRNEALQRTAGDSGTWQRTDLVEKQMEFMFLDFVNRDRQTEVAVATRNGVVLQMVLDSKLKLISSKQLSNPNAILFGKAVAIGDIDLDGKMDLVHSCNTRSIAKRKDPIGLHWIQTDKSDVQSYPVGGKKGKKYDRIELLDLDGDGDLDVLTCEEADNLGVIWFENPVR